MMRRGSGVIEGNPEELRELACASLVLRSWRIMYFEQETLDTLHQLKIKFQSGQTEENPEVSIEEKVSIKENSEEETSIEENPKNTVFKEALHNQENATQGEISQNNESWAVPPVSHLTGIMGKCSKPFTKQLTVSDVKENQCRLVINKLDFQEYLKPLLNEEEDLTKGVSVTTYDPEGKEYPMIFKNWQNVHVLNGGWKQFCKDHGLKQHEDWVTIRMFRHAETGKPCFEITSKRLETKEPMKIMRKKQKV